MTRELTNPIHIITEQLSLPHGVRLSPDRETLVITNYGLKAEKDVIHWGYSTDERTDNVLVFRRAG